MKIPKFKMFHKSSLQKLRRYRRKAFVVLILAIFVITSYQIWEYLNPNQTKAVWYDTSWNFRKKFSVDPAKVATAGDLTNFAIVINQTFPELVGNTQALGQDILFTDATGTTKLDHEIEKFVSTTGEIVVWIEIPTLSTSSATDIYMYYGNINSSSQQNPSGVWNSTFSAVYHFAEDPSTGNFLDSTSNNNDCVPSGTDGWVSGDRVSSNLGYAVNFGLENRYLDCGDSNSLDFASNESFSILLWYYERDTDNAVKNIITKTNSNNPGSSFTGFFFQFRDDLSADYMQARINDGEAVEVAGNRFNAGNEVGGQVWNQTIVSIDRSNASTDTADAYLNGTNTITDTSDAYNADLSNTSSLNFNAADNNVSTMWGMVSEAWVYNSTISSTEVTTIYNNQYDNQTFFSSISSAERRREPRAHWKMDEGSGTSIQDTAGVRTDGTASNITWETTEANCVMGKCLTFAGVGANNNRVTISDNVDLDFTAGTSFTIETWFKHDTASAQQVLISKYNEAGYKLLMESDGDITCGIDYDSTWSPTDSVTSTLATYDDNTWHYASCVKNGNTSLTLYIDGVSVGTPDTSLTNSTLANSDPLYIGIDADAASLDWVGNVDEVKLYDYARSASEILTDYIAGASSSGSNAVLGKFSTGLPLSPSVHWKFDEASSTTAYDSESATSSNGSISGATWTLQSNCKYNNCLNFDSANEVVTIATASDSEVDFATTDTFSASAWVYPITMPGSGEKDAIIAKWDQTTTIRGYRLFLENDDADSTGNFKIEIFDESTDQTISATTSTDYVSANTWYHVSFTFNGGTSGTAGDLKLYINGIKINQNSGASFGGLEDVAADFTVGEYDTNDAVAENTAFAGYIDDVKVYSSALGDASVMIDYNAGSVVNFGTGSNERLIVEPSPTPVDYKTKLAGYWPMDENTNDTCASSKDACDRSGNSNDGALTGALWDSGKFGSSLDFDGTDDVVTITNAAAIDFDSGLLSAVTFSGWIYPDTAGEGTGGQIFFKGTNTWCRVDTLTTTDLDLQCSLDLATADATINITDAVYTTGWYHIAMTYTDDSDDEISVYVNGKLVGTSTGGNGSPASGDTNDLLIGGTTTNNFNGRIDNFKVHSTGLSTGQIAYEYSRGKPLGWWKFDECSGSTANDSSGNGYSGTITPGASTYTSTGTCNSGSATQMWDGNNQITGRVNSSLAFDGGDDYVDMNDVAAADFNDSNFSISFWFNRETFTTDDTIIAKKNNQLNSTAGFIVWIDDSTDDIRMVVSDGDSTNLHTVDSTSSFTATGWYHAVITYDDSSNTAPKIYINGVDNKASNATTGTFGSINDLSNAVDLRIGSESDGGEPFAGELDDVRLYNYVLSSDQVKQVYTGGAVRFE